MAFQTDTKYGPLYSFWSGESTGSCRPLKVRSRTYPAARTFESVTSWRGPVQEIKVGSKIKKPYNSFSVFKFLPSPAEPNPGYLCESNRVVYYEEFPLSVFNPTTIAVARSLGPSYWEEVPPYISGSDLASLGGEYREFVMRDLHAKANSPRFSVAVFLAELDETLVGVKDLFKGCLGALLKANGLYKTMKRLSLNGEELWLWWRYALMPAMLEAEALLAALKPQRFVDRVQDMSNTKGHLSKVALSKRWTASNLTVRLPWECRWTVGAGGAMDILSKSDPHQWGTGGWDVVAAAYERVPFSFVFDWFINLGDYLASLRDADVVFAQSYATYAVDVTTIVTNDNFVMQKPLSLHCVKIERITAFEPPLLPLVDRRWRNILRTVDSIALITGYIKSIIQVTPNYRRKKRR